MLPIRSASDPAASDSLRYDRATLVELCIRIFQEAIYPAPPGPSASPQPSSAPPSSRPAPPALDSGTLPSLILPEESAGMRSIRDMGQKRGGAELGF